MHNFRWPTVGLPSRIWLAAPIAVAAVVFGLVVPAQASQPAQSSQPTQSSQPARSASAPAATANQPQQSNQPLPSLVGHAPAGAKRWLVSDPVAYGQALKSARWVHTPSGLSNTSCVFHVPSRATVRNGLITLPSGATRQLKPCADPTLTYPGAAAPRASQPRASKPGASQLSPAAASTGSPCYFGSGGTYWAASCNGTSPSWVTSMTQEQAVPNDPAKDGALIFLWGGLENADGDTLLQDVLTWGANGNIVTNPNIWYVTPWYLWGGNSVIGSSIHVGVSDTIVQSLTSSSCSSGGACTWVLKATDTTNGLSTSYTVGSDATFTAIFGAVMEVPSANGCVETPPDGHAAFRDLVVTANTGTLSPSFGTSTPDPQCSVSITQSSTGADILWKP